MRKLIAGVLAAIGIGSAAVMAIPAHIEKCTQEKYGPTTYREGYINTSDGPVLFQTWQNGRYFVTIKDGDKTSIIDQITGQAVEQCE